jgi:hypothetical protein
MSDSPAKEFEQSIPFFLTKESKKEYFCFVGFTSVAFTDQAVKLYRTSKYVSIFAAEATTIIMNLEKSNSVRTSTSVLSPNPEAVWKPHAQSPTENAIILYLQEEMGKIVHFY